ncbi:MAG TPA: RimK/LysX family protein [Polyangia bacterium]
MRLGWTERVNLPDLGLAQVAAKIDTGARTSALHITAMRPMPSSGAAPAPGRLRAEPVRDRLLVVLARGSTIEVEVEEWVVVRDTSGRRERRPVIVTTLHVGRVRRTIRLGLTDRGDMRYPLLVGRTALPPGTLVDPNARNLLLAVPVRSNPVGRLGVHTNSERSKSRKLGKPARKVGTKVRIGGKI